MEVLGSGQKAGRRQPVYAVKDEEEFAFHTNFYLEPPYFESLTLQDFEAHALERLKVLRVFENVGFKSTKGSPEYKDLILKELTKELRYRYIKPLAGTADHIVAENKRIDVLSHFILRMVFSRSEDQRRWYIQQEVDLFRHRLSEEESGVVGQFLTASGFSYVPLPVEEYRNIRPILEKSTFFRYGSNAIDTEFYKLDFLEALQLVKKRHVFVSMGYAFVPRRFLVDVVAERFKDQLVTELAKLSKIILESQEETRLFPVLSKLAVGYTGKDYSAGDVDFGITPANLDQLSNESFPLCARNMHEHLRKDHHLKHDARLQYGLFLKGIGLSIEDALKLFRQEFAQHGISEKSFNSGHVYNIRHMYGKEGRRVNYAPFSCSRIIMGKSPGGSTEHHGCPFKHFNSALLDQRLNSYGLSKDDCTTISGLAKLGHFTIACTRYFEVIHKKQLQTVVEPIQHPNQFFEESRRLLHPETVKDRPAMFSKKFVPNAAIKSKPVDFRPNPAPPTDGPPVSVEMDFADTLNDDELESMMAAMDAQMDVDAAV